MNPIFLKTNKMPGHVYLIGSRKFHWFKIGKSSNATIRVNQLGILLPFPIEVFAVWKTSAPSVLEYQLHQKYAANRINGEWFSFTAEEVNCLIHEMLYASTEVTAGFSNAVRDAPEGKVLKIEMRADLTNEERERRKQEAIANKRPKTPCPTCGVNTRRVKIVDSEKDSKDTPP